MTAFRLKTKACALRGGLLVLIALSIAWWIAADVHAGPIRRMYRRAARTMAYPTPYAPSAAYGPAPPVSPAPLASSAPYAEYPPYGPIGRRLPPPPYYFFSGVLRPGFGPPWAGAPWNYPDEGPPANGGPASSGGPPPADDDAAGEPLSDRTFVSGLYRDILGREPDEPGVTAWVHALRRGMSRRAVVNYFLNSRERARPLRPRPATPRDQPETNVAGDPIAPEPIERPNPELSGARPVPEAIPPAEEPPAETEQPAIGGAEDLPEEVPVPPVDAPPPREREF